MRYLFLAVVPLALLAGCDSRPDRSASAGSPAATPAPTPAMTPAPPATAAASAPAAGLALDGEGLRVVDPRSGATRLLAFGSARAGVEEPVTRSLGRPSSSGRNEECPAGPTDYVTYGPLTLDFIDGRFVAWTLSDRPTGRGAALATMDSITVGTTRAEAEESRVITPVEGSTLDGEFAFGPGGMSGAGGGFLSGTGPQARITGLFAGANCFFR